MEEQSEPTTEEFIEALLRPQRQENLDPFMVITFMPIEPYDIVADIGCGPGYFTIPLAKHLVYGKLYALDIVDEMLDVTRQRVAESNLGNVEVLQCGPMDFPIPDESLNGVFLAFVTHESEDKVAFLQTVKKLLKPRGWCTILEFYKKETEEEGPPLAVRMDPDEVERVAREAGFHFRWWRDINGSQYMALLRNRS